MQLVFQFTGVRKTHNSTNNFRKAQIKTELAIISYIKYAKDKLIKIAKQVKASWRKNQMTFKAKWYEWEKFLKDTHYVEPEELEEETKTWKEEIILAKRMGYRFLDLWSNYKNDEAPGRKQNKKT